MPKFTYTGEDGEGKKITKTDELVMITRNLGSMLTAGLTVTRAISVIERQSKNPKLKDVLTNINERINNGQQFYEALKEFPEVFSDLYVAMIKSGEESGNLSESLKPFQSRWSVQ